jgi:hypothetical protein
MRVVSNLSSGFLDSGGRFVTAFFVVLKDSANEEPIITMLQNHWQTV